MLNGTIHNSFCKEIVVVNHLAEMPDEQKAVDEALNFKVHAEGGEILQSLNNRVVVTSNQLTYSSQLAIVDENEALISEGTLVIPGVYTFNFTPLPQKEYYILNYKDFKKQKVFGIKANGLNIQLKENSTTQYVFDLNSNIVEDRVNVLIENNEGLIESQSVMLSGKNTITLNKAQLKTGLVRIKILSRFGRVLVYRLFFHIANINNSLQCQLSKNTYTRRDEINISASILPTNEAMLKGTFSVSVMPKDLYDVYGNNHNINQVNFLPLSIKERLQSLAYTSDIYNSLSNENINDLLIACTENISGLFEEQTGQQEVNLSVSGVISENGKAIKSGFMSFASVNSNRVYFGSAKENGIILLSTTGILVITSPLKLRLKIFPLPTPKYKDLTHNLP
jgi:predicted secreted protein